MVSVKQLTGATAQYAQIIKMLDDGSLSPSAVRRGLQGIIERRSVLPNSYPPAWWRTPEQQLERARQLWPGVESPELPSDFVPQTETEVLLLHVPDTMYELWNRVTIPGYDEYSSCGLDESNYGRIGARSYKGSEWVAFDPEHCKGGVAHYAPSGLYLAASEVLSALIQFPDWPLTWQEGASAPNLSGFRYQPDQNCYVPFINLQADGRRCIELGFWATSSEANWASPSVRKC